MRVKPPRLALFFLLPLLTALCCGATSYVWTKKNTASLIAGILDHSPRIAVRGLVWSFGKAEHARELIRREPDEEPRDRTRLFRRIRLAVLADSAEERERLLQEAGAASAESPKERDLVRLVGAFARSRLVPPGDDIPCEYCTVKRQPLPAVP